jgi:hypothetical protein
VPASTNIIKLLYLMGLPFQLPGRESLQLTAVAKQFPCKTIADTARMSDGAHTKLEGI